MEWYFAVLKKYAEFSGRARRLEYWSFCLISTGISFVLGTVDGGLGAVHLGTGVGLLEGVYLLVVMIPSLAVTVRRLHDTGRSGAWLLILFLPLIGFVWLLVLMVLEGTPGDNKYGPNPKIVVAQV